MSKILIIDGHSILNRAFYGLPPLTNSEGLHTNAVLGFLNIIFKIMDEEKPDRMCVAFDVHEPTFRHKKYSAYKGTRKPMPDELREQVPVIKELLRAMNITTVEKGGYEADDIIGTLSRMAERERVKAVIVSGDRDLLQLATDSILVRIPKTKSQGTVVENYYADDVKTLYGVTPIEFIDMKGLMGDASDNIPGVPGIGEKTASKIIMEYGSIENALAHIDEIKPAKAQNSLREHREEALLSKELATIKLDCELQVSMDDMNINDIFNQKAYELFKKYEFKSLLGKFDRSEMESSAAIIPDITLIEDMGSLDNLFNEAVKEKEAGIYFITSEDEDFLGVSVAFSDNRVYIVRDGGAIDERLVADKVLMLAEAGVNLCFMDLKSALKFVPLNEDFLNVQDVSVAAYLINPLKDTYFYDDIARDFLGVPLPSEKELKDKKDINIFSFYDGELSKIFAYNALVPVLAFDTIKEELSKTLMLSLYETIEKPTVYTLYDMEKRGIRVEREALFSYSLKLSDRIERLHDEIISYAGCDFNINSPKQLGEVLFEKMGLSGGKKTKTGYSTSVDVLEKIKNTHPIIPDILEYRQLTKLNSTYAKGLVEFIREDGRIHGTFNQTITATGRISSTEPNLQNIPMRMELGRLIRKAFVPEEGYVFVDADYSQIELRVLAHLSGDAVMKQSFLDKVDIHATTASEVFGVPVSEVTPLMRRNAKAVNFGIVYGISAYGLSEDLGISRKEASLYIDKYFETYKEIRKYLDEQMDFAKTNGYVKTMCGRRRPIPELKSSNFMQRSFGERVAMNSPIQGTAADIIKIAMVNVNRELKSKNMKSRLILQIHDELLIEAELSEVEQVKEILNRQMMDSVKLSVPLEINIAQGDNWYDAK